MRLSHRVSVTIILFNVAEHDQLDLRDEKPNGNEAKMMDEKKKERERMMKGKYWWTYN